MTRKDYISPRGVYYDLEKSPYEATDDLGHVFKFSSQKKLNMFNVLLERRQKAWDNEIANLEKMGYIITKDYNDNLKHVPEKVYRDMLYK